MTTDPFSPVARKDAKILIRTLYRGTPDEVRQSMAEIIRRREEMAPYLLVTIERANANCEHPDIDHIGAMLAMYVLAQFRETRALLPILRLLELADDQISFIFGDVLTENLPAILVSVADDLAPIERLARNERRHRDARLAAFSAIRVAVAVGRMTREDAMTIYGDVLRSELARGEDADAGIVESIAMDTLDLAPREIEAELREAMNAGLISGFAIEPEELEAALRCNPEAALKRLRRDRHNKLIDDAVEACAWWSLFHAPTELDEAFDDEPLVTRTVQYLEPKSGRNDPCPCGSGRKYKKCCGVQA